MCRSEDLDTDPLPQGGSLRLEEGHFKSLSQVRGLNEVEDEAGGRQPQSENEGADGVRQAQGQDDSLE